MNLLAGRLLCHGGMKSLPKCGAAGIRALSGGDSCPKEPCPSSSSCEPPPCPPPPSPPCPDSSSFSARLCPENIDPGNPCNYCPPPCRDGPDLTKLKKNQCHFQQDDGLPVYLKGGTKDKIVFQGIVFLVFTSLIGNLYSLLKIIQQ